MDNSNDMVQSALAMASSRKTCTNCWHNREGDCAMFSCECATDILNHAREPRWWTSYEDGEENEKRVWKGRR